MVLDFMVPPLMCGLGAEGPVQSNHCERTGRRVRLSGITLHLKRLVSSQIIAGRALNAQSDGAFAKTAFLGLGLRRQKSLVFITTSRQNILHSRLYQFVF